VHTRESSGTSTARRSVLTDSFSLTTFSPSGKLVQIEHALAAVAGGTTSLGIKGGSSYIMRGAPPIALFAGAASSKLDQGSRGDYADSQQPTVSSLLPKRNPLLSFSTPRY
jgi:hypothetical protein